MKAILDFVVLSMSSFPWKLVAVFGLFAIIVAGGLWLSKGDVLTTYQQNTVLAGPVTIADGERMILENGAQLTVEGDLTIQGTLSCKNGPLNLIVKGNLQVNQLMECYRADDTESLDGAQGIMAVVEKGVDFSKTAVVASNGHVQFVRSADQLATTSPQINQLYQRIATPSSEGKFRIGPFIQNDGNLPIPTRKTSALQPSLETAQVAPSSAKNGFFFQQAFAGEPATDLQGNPVANTVRLGGTWIVGDPSFPPPANLDIPTPPKKIDKIIVNFNFGVDKMKLQDFELTGPNGRPGTPGDTCTAKGGKGQDAFRMNVHAGSLDINNFKLHLGAGGTGGEAVTSGECDSAVATGGDGGEAGNFKMITEDDFTISGLFEIFPGRGGDGGRAVATGKKGADDCGGDKGGDASATGGKGGQNKKGLLASGVEGTSSIIIHDQLGGNGGEATANGGNGGNGTGSACDGGVGGKATATGGKGGDAFASTFTAIGGNGGNATATPGAGGIGGAGSSTTPGGNGGNGGDAVGKGGQPGTGSSGDGTEGVVNQQTGGNGGNGGDGCGPGNAGAGGSGNPAGQPGKPGKNLCIPLEEAPAVTTPNPPETFTTPGMTPEPGTNELPGDTFTPGDHEVEDITVSKDDCGHKGFIGLATKKITVTDLGDGKVSIGGDGKWVTVEGMMTDGSLTATGKGTVAGFKDIQVDLKGSITDGVFAGELTMGADKKLPGKCPITYSIRITL